MRRHSPERRRPISAKYPGGHLPEVHTTGSIDNIKDNVSRPHTQGPIRVLYTRTLHSVTGCEIPNYGIDHHVRQEHMGMCEHVSELMSPSTPIKRNESGPLFLYLLCLVLSEDCDTNQRAT
ncbi:hypothetical protein HBI56_081510 [Parastagonospora nodorum]|nr:hypothetical protein HBI10_121060 [Parastagonospora nodorum]KAH4025004.1 hypothetical protein HBI13_076130 [Parastagonospora nodorum]KAH5399278.1 hypothetical protein HBI32_182560 [Parastagonospora nodorum]KAH5540902.1 hypothetical protein HBI27_096650 [Parastagonospora nodorum]KAH6522950.1 hypothetical protein HBI56_081510 [Parastagonospora nodorum]